MLETVDFYGHWPPFLDENSHFLRKWSTDAQTCIGYYSLQHGYVTLHRPSNIAISTKYPLFLKVDKEVALAHMEWTLFDFPTKPMTIDTPTWRQRNPSQEARSLPLALFSRMLNLQNVLNLGHLFWGYSISSCWADSSSSMYLVYHIGWKSYLPLLEKKCGQPFHDAPLPIIKT